jgi:predicted SprT family Zn-dependent metalloprotease
MASSHLSLKRWFNFYNKRYFNSELPANTRLFWSPLTRNHAHMEDYEIHLDPALQLFPKFMRIMLLHEMVHLHNPRLGHGKKFQDEIERLWIAGAFIPLLQE